MGSLNPLKTPKTTPIVFQEPTPIPEVVENVELTQQELDQQSSEERAKNILKRRRGRTGTITTSFRGVLSPSDLSPRRKTLLGE